MPSIPASSGHKFIAVVFDLDGTLIDSAPDIHLALNRTLAEAGRDDVTLDAVKRMVGDGAERLVESGFAATGEAVAGAPLRRAYEAFSPTMRGQMRHGLPGPTPASSKPSSGF